MSISVNCPECGAINQVNDSLAGRRVRCPQCDTAVHVPELDGGTPPALPDDALEVEALEVEALEVEAVEVETVEATPVAPVAAVASAATPASLLEDDDDDDDLADFGRKKREEEDADMTPMVDVTFLLLIFFMVTAAFSLQKSIQMPRQQTDLPSQTQQDDPEEVETTELEIDEFGSFFIMSPTFERETPGKQNLIINLKKAIDDNGGKTMKMVIKVHEQCKLQFLVDAMDAGTLTGFSPIQVTQVEGF
ncbi:MAG: biopolymer transporter ExbD [Planctomycetota bacterium]